MPQIRINQVEIEYEEIGKGEPIVLIMGIGVQLIHWPDGFCDMLAKQGFRVIRFDNRDVGLSTKFHDHGVPDLKSLMLRRIFQLSIESPYRLHDMAEDTAKLIESLGEASAHIVGVSMGGMIAQTLAITHPTHVRTLTSIMSHPGNLYSSICRPKALKALLQKPPRNADEAADRALTFYQTCGSTGYPLDVESIRERAKRGYERCAYPPGFARHFSAIVASGSRKSLLKNVRVPTLVIHGTEDPLIPPRGAEQTCQAIPQAKLLWIDGMGHDLPEGAWPTMIEAITHQARHLE
jgi:pimeloyl-ACP methyl ester carboxylesterase